MLPFYAFQHQEYFIEPGESVVREGADSTMLRRAEEVSDWFWESVWHEEPAAGATENLEACRWLVFVDRTGVGEGLIQRLRAGGHDVIEVREADEFVRANDHSYGLAPEQGRIGYNQLAAALAEDELLPDRVVHLWSLTTSKKVRAGSSWFHHVQDRGFLSLIHLVQAMADQVPDLEQGWTIVTNGAQPVRGAADHPEKALRTRGRDPTRVLGHERMRHRR